MLKGENAPEYGYIKRSLSIHFCKTFGDTRMLNRKKKSEYIVVMVLMWLQDRADQFLTPSLTLLIVDVIMKLLVETTVIKTSNIDT